VDTHQPFCFRAGLNAIYVHTHATNQPAFKLYVKMGFEVIILCNFDVASNQVLVEDEGKIDFAI